MVDEEPRHLTPNQIVAINLRRARDRRRLTQAEVVQRLAKHLGEEWSVAVLSAAERSAYTGRVRQFTADHLIAFAETFNLPVAFFLRLHWGTFTTGAPGAEPITADQFTSRVEPLRGRWPLGELLRAARRNKGWSMEQAADAAGSSYDHWRSAETGFSHDREGVYSLYHPWAPTISKFAEAVGADVAQCLRAAGLDDDVETVIEDREDRRHNILGALQSSIRNLPYGQMKALATVVRAMTTVDSAAYELSPDQERLSEIRWLIEDLERSMRITMREYEDPHLSGTQRESALRYGQRLYSRIVKLNAEAYPIEVRLGVAEDQRVGAKLAKLNDMPGIKVAYTDIEKQT